jgi:hypothetical protein
MERVAMLFARAIMLGSLACGFRFLTLNVMLELKAFVMPIGKIGNQPICGKQHDHLPHLQSDFASNRGAGTLKLASRLKRMRSRELRPAKNCSAAG